MGASFLEKKRNKSYFIIHAIVPPSTELTESDRVDSLMTAANIEIVLVLDSDEAAHVFFLVCLFVFY